MLLQHSTFNQHRHYRMLQYRNGNNATSASETKYGRPITASQGGEAQNTAA
jgi:hypothetical protein